MKGTPGGGSKVSLPPIIHRRLSREERDGTRLGKVINTLVKFILGTLDVGLKRGA